MIYIYYTNTTTEWTDATLREMLDPLPEEMRNKIMTYRDWQERQSRILGRWMLIALLDKLKIRATLADLKHSQFNKPYFNDKSDFSIAHSNGLVIAAGTRKGKVGVDIEKISALGVEDYEDQLTLKEWQKINNSPDRIKAFFDIWTKKEALVKAMGIGINIELNTLEVCKEKIKIKGRKYSFFPLFIAPNYTAHIATSAPVDTDAISVQEFNASP